MDHVQEKTHSQVNVQCSNDPGQVSHLSGCPATVIPFQMRCKGKLFFTLIVPDLLNGQPGIASGWKVDPFPGRALAVSGGKIFPPLFAFSIYICTCIREKQPW